MPTNYGAHPPVEILEKLSVSDIDSTDSQTKRQTTRYSGRGGKGAPNSSSRGAIGTQGLQHTRKGVALWEAEERRGQSSSSTHLLSENFPYTHASPQPYPIYQHMMVFQHPRQHIAPRELPPYVSGTGALGHSSRPGGISKKKNTPPPIAPCGNYGGASSSNSEEVQDSEDSRANIERPAHLTDGNSQQPSPGANPAIPDNAESDDLDNNQTTTDEIRDLATGNLEICSTSEEHCARDLDTPTSNEFSDINNGWRGQEKIPCAFFLKTGSCAYGDRCKFYHPYDKAPVVMFNSAGLPMRPGEPPCSFFLKNFRCAFGHTCKYHHPEHPAAAPTQTPPTAMHPGVQYMPVQYQTMSPQMGPINPMQGMGYFSAPHGMGGIRSGQSGRLVMTPQPGPMEFQMMERRRMR